MPDSHFGVTRIGPQSRISNSPHPRQVRTKQEEEGEHHGNSETADLQRLMADPTLRGHVASATSAALPAVPSGTCIGDTAADMADVMLPSRPNWHRALSARAEHRAGVRTLAYRLR